MQIPCCLPSEHFAGNLVSEAVHNFGIFWLLAWAIVIPHTSKDRYMQMGLTERDLDEVKDRVCGCVRCMFEALDCIGCCELVVGPC